MSTPAIELDDDDWKRLAALREQFLAASDSPAPLADYWTNPRDLAIYDATFGARIRWKWEAVLGEIASRGLAVPAGRVVDFGAGTAVATRAFLARFGEGGRTFAFEDRSSAARSFAREATLAECPAAVLDEDLTDAPDVLLASHVLDELDAAGRARFSTLLRRARFVIWVEAGSKRTSRALSALRDELLDVHDPLLPCTHRERCGVLAAGREADWCHHFAPPAPEAFTTAFWRTFSRTLGIDLRAVPYAWLVLGARADRARSDTGLARVLGTPRFEKGRVRLLTCSDAGVEDTVVLERLDKGWFRALEKGTGGRLLRLERQGTRITRLEAR